MVNNTLTVKKNQTLIAAIAPILAHEKEFAATA